MPHSLVQADSSLLTLPFVRGKEQPKLSDWLADELMVVFCPCVHRATCFATFCLTTINTHFFQLITFNSNAFRLLSTPSSESSWFFFVTHQKDTKVD